MKKAKRIVYPVLVILIVLSMLSGCIKLPGRRSGGQSTINKAEVLLPSPTDIQAGIDDAQQMAVGSYLVARMYLEMLLQYDADKGNKKEYDKLLADTIKAFETAEKVSDALYGAALYSEVVVKSGGVKFDGKAKLQMIRPVNLLPTGLGITAHAATESEAMKWAREITEIYDKAPSNKGVKTLADQLGTDCKHAYAQLKQAQAILEGGAYSDFADYANTCYKTAYALKAAGTTAGLVVSVAVAGPATGLAAVAQTGGIVMGGVNTVLEIGAAGSVIYTNGEGNEVTTFCEKTEAQMAPVGQVFSVMSLGLNAHKLLTGGYSSDAAKALKDGTYTSYLDGVKNDIFGATAYLGTSVYDYMDSGSILSGTFTKTNEGFKFTLMDTLKGTSGEEEKNVKEVMKAAGVTEEQAEEAIKNKAPADVPKLNEVPLETAEKIIEEYKGVSPEGGFDGENYENAIDDYYGERVSEYIEEKAQTAKDKTSFHISSESGSFDFYDGTGALFDAKTGARVMWTHDEDGELYFIHPDDREYSVDDDGNLLVDGKPLLFDGKPINVFSGTGGEPEEETSETATAAEDTGGIEDFLGTWDRTNEMGTNRCELKLQDGKFLIITHGNGKSVTSYNSYKYDPETGILNLKETSCTEPLAQTTADHFTFKLSADGNTITTYYYHYAYDYDSDGNVLYKDGPGGTYTRVSD